MGALVRGSAPLLFSCPNAASVQPQLFGPLGYRAALAVCSVRRLHRYAVSKSVTHTILSIVHKLMNAPETWYLVPELQLAGPPSLSASQPRVVTACIVGVHPPSITAALLTVLPHRSLLAEYRSIKTCFQDARGLATRKGGPRSAPGRRSAACLRPITRPRSCF